MTTIEMRVQNMLPNMSNSDRQVAQYFLSNKDQIFQYPLAQLAKFSGTTTVAWVRFCKTIGYEGMKGLKNALFHEMNQTVLASEEGAPAVQFTDITQHTSLTSLAENVCASNIHALESTLKLFDESTFRQVIDAIIQARSIRFFGIGASNLVAYDLYCKFLRIGYSVYYAQDYHMALTYASTSSSQDVGLIYSNSGETPEMIKIANILKENGTTTVSITKYCENSLSHTADHCLYINSAEIYKRSGAMGSRIAQLCINDILFTAIANRDYPNIEDNLINSYEKCHPDVL